MITHKYRTVDVPVEGGLLRVGVWDPIEVGEGAAVPSVLAIHGITSTHLVWQYVVAELPGMRVIAPDLRGRGASNGLPGPGGMRAHALDMLAVLDAFALDGVPVMGHSMGGFVSVVLAFLAPARVSQLVLVDGGLPLDPPAGLAPEELAQAILGPTMDRLSKRFASVAEYLEFWREHPAFTDGVPPEMESYFAYDLVPAGEMLRPSTSPATTGEDAIDMNLGEAVPSALDALGAWGRPVILVTVPFGLQGQTPGLYAPEHLARMLDRYPVRHVALPGLNHYTIVMSVAGAGALGVVVRAELA